MKNQTFLGAFVMFIGLIGLIVGLVNVGFNSEEFKSHLVLYFLPIIIGGIMIIVDQVGKHK